MTALRRALIRRVLRAPSDPALGLRRRRLRPPLLCVGPAHPGPRAARALVPRADRAPHRPCPVDAALAGWRPALPVRAAAAAVLGGVRVDGGGLSPRCLPLRGR